MYLRRLIGFNKNCCNQIVQKSSFEKFFFNSFTFFKSTEKLFFLSFEKHLSNYNIKKN